MYTQPAVRTQPAGYCIRFYNKKDHIQNLRTTTILRRNSISCAVKTMHTKILFLAQIIIYEEKNMNRTINRKVLYTS